MFKGSGLIRVHPRFNAPSEQAAGADSNSTIRSDFWRFRFWGVILFAWLSGIMVTAVTVLHLFSPAFTTDLFTPYQLIFPRVGLVDLRSLDCRTHSISPFTREEQCTLAAQPTDAGKFRLITVTIHDGQVGALSFLCDDVYVGDLVNRWGRPNSIERVLNGYLLYWDNDHVIAQVHADKWFSYRLPVESVLLK